VWSTGTAASVGVTTTKILLDSGAVNSFISPDFVKKLDLQAKVQPYLAWDPTARKRFPKAFAQLADGSMQPINGFVAVPVHLGKYKAVLKCFVTTLGVYDLILGDNWLRANKATLDYGARCVVIKPGKKRFTLRPEDGLKLAHEPLWMLMRQQIQRWGSSRRRMLRREELNTHVYNPRAVNCEQIMISAMKAKKLLRQKGVRYRVIHVKPSVDD
jgi:hypothetical protein